MKFAEIIFQRKTEPLTYKIPENLAVKEGQLVEVNLRNRKTTGLILKTHSRRPPFKTSPILKIIFKKPLLTATQLKLIIRMHDYYLCPLYKIVKLFIPKRIFDNKPIKSQDRDHPQPEKSTPKTLTENQKRAIGKITGDVKPWLIHGITGSGKTEIYSRLAEYYIEKGAQVLILVPEISLTPQIIEYFEKSLGISATVINSKISEGEKFRAWKDIWQKKTKLIIGSRSAIFCPFQKLELIIIDEEHEHSYKQENEPRYATHKIAEQIIIEAKGGVKLVYGSATPSIETAEGLKDSTIRLNTRIGNSSLPVIEIIDLRDEFKKGNFSIFSESLKEALNEILVKKQQAILFLNRRGAASSVVCRDCGYTEKCKNCELPLTYHLHTLKKATLICHHCGTIKQPPVTCPVCHGPNIRFLGVGTQKIETALAQEFPTARVLRADKDTTAKKHGFRDIYRAFKNHEADILIGTQMIAKGLHLPKVNLVGVVLADIGLNIPDFRSTERNFQLMTQVAGRAGRSGNNGRVVIQSYNPDHIALVCAKTHSYDEFFRHERTQRKLLGNPPFGKLVKVMVEDVSLDGCRSRAEEIANKLKNLAENHNRLPDTTDKTEINFYPAYLSRLREKYRYIVLIKNPEPEILKNLPDTVKIDVDPISVN